MCLLDVLVEDRLGEVREITLISWDETEGEISYESEVRDRLYYCGVNIDITCITRDHVGC